MAKEVKGKLAREIGGVAKSQRRVSVRKSESKDDKVTSSNSSSAGTSSNEGEVASPKTHLKPSRRRGPKKRMMKQVHPILRDLMQYMIAMMRGSSLLSGQEQTYMVHSYGKD